jgi:Outer membrane protein beta-barrel domain
MKKTVLAVVMLLFINQLCVKAQNVEVGLKGGISFTNIASNSFTGNYRPAYHVGAFATKSFKGKWGIQAELLYNQVSAKKSDDFDKIYYNLQNTVSDGTANISYVNVPVLVTYQLNKTFSFNLGPQIGAAFYTNEMLFRNGQNAFKTLDASLVGGAKVNLSGVQFYGRYNYGFSNINNYDNRDTWKNMQLSFGVEVPVFKWAKK